MQAKDLLGKRIEIPVHYDLWMRGARFGTVTQARAGQLGQSDYVYVRMDHPQVRRRLKLWQPDWEYVRICYEEGHKPLCFGRARGGGDWPKVRSLERG